MMDDENKADSGPDKMDKPKPKQDRPEQDISEQDTPATEIEQDAQAHVQAEESDSQARNETSHKTGHTFIYGFLLFVILLGASGAGGYYLWMQSQKQGAELRRALEEQNRKLGSQIESLQTQTADINRQSENVQQRLGQLDKHQQQLGDTVSALNKSRGQTRNDWLLAEAEYLAGLANQRLILAGDVDSALAALQSADQRLKAMADPAIIPVRQQLATDINQLKAVDLPDIAGLSSTLSALAKAVDDLVLIAPQAEEVLENGTTAAKDRQVESWKDLPGAIWEDMKKLLVVREHHGRIKPLLTPSQHYFLKQNLILKLEQAQLALMDGNGEVFRQQLRSASEWVEEYFDPEDPATRNMLEQIRQLQAAKIQPVLPDISGSYHALQSFRKPRAEASSEARP